MVNILLSQCGADIIWAKNGDEVLDIFEKNKNIDLILLDIKMPVKDGIETAMEIRKSNYNIPIIAQTAYAQNGDKERIIIAGFNNYIAKPIQKNDLFKVISKYI